jgi:tetratricopeptide (TPR) repeat protein
MNKKMLLSRIITIARIVFTSIILFSQTAFSQVNLDSLWTVWNDTSQPDTTRLKAMQDIAWDGYLFSQPDSAFNFAQLEYDFAKSKGLKKHMAIALNTMGVSFWVQGDYTTAIAYFDRSLTINEEIGSKKGIASSLNNFGIIYQEQGDFSNAVDYYTHSLTIKEEIGDKKGIAISLSNIGIVYEEQGDYASAIDYHTRSLQIREEIGDKWGIAMSTSNIGIIYNNHGDYANALEYNNRSLSIWEEIGDKRGIAASFINIGNIYEEQGDYTSAIDYYTRSLTINEEIGDKMGIASSLTNIGNIYNYIGNYPSALDYHNRSLTLYEEIGNKMGVASTLNHIGTVYEEQGDYNSAISYNTRAIIIAQELGDAIETRDAANALFKEYKATGNHKLSLEMYELYITTRDSIKSEENQKEVIRQKYKYDYEKQTIADSVAYVQVQKIQEAKLEKSRILQYALLGGIVLLIAFLIYVYNRFRLTQKQKIIISEQNKELATATKLAESTNSELKTKSEELEKFNNVMLDREMRIIELKEEANKMAKDNNTNLPYPEVEDE